MSVCVCFNFFNVQVQVDLPFRDSMQKVKVVPWLCFILNKSSIMQGSVLLEMK